MRALSYKDISENVEHYKVKLLRGKTKIKKKKTDRNQEKERSLKT